jgi:hypothetical protein
MNASIVNPLSLRFLFFCALTSFAIPVAVMAGNQRPNVIVIMSDDQGGGDYGFQGNPLIETPSLDTMFKNGGCLTNFYVSPVCAPTRASLMTGRYLHRSCHDGRR